MKEKWIERCKQITPAKYKRNILLLYALVLLVAGIFYVIGRLNLLELAITYVVLAFCIIPALRL